MDLTPFEPFFSQLARSPLRGWRGALAARIERRSDAHPHGDLPKWEAALACLPELPAGRVQIAGACVGVEGVARPAPEAERGLADALSALHPWRKGPFCLFGLRIDAEWRSDLKWERLVGSIAPLNDRLVLDVGCGNGYFAWRMLGAGARLVMGIDPSWLFVMQWRAVHRYLGRDELAVLPLPIEDLPDDLTGFDTVFSMGVLYHRRSPMDHLLDLRRLLRPGGELVLETLVLESAGEAGLVPPGRYAGMRNVRFIPTVDALAVWLTRCGFIDVRVVDRTRTTPFEQRATRWMRFRSLSDHLHPQDPTRTIEGHPAPVRAILTANRAELSP